MSLVVDALKKLKNEQAASVQTEPQALDVYIDDEGKKNEKPSNGVIAAAVVLCALIAAAVVIGVIKRTNDDASIANKATVVAQKETMRENVKKSEFATGSQKAEKPAEKVHTDEKSNTKGKYIDPLKALSDGK